jgi:hypothetical protein
MIPGICLKIVHRDDVVGGGQAVGIVAMKQGWPWVGQITEAGDRLFCSSMVVQV